MSLTDFVNKWLGKRTDYDHVYAYQCVDLILQYLADCYGITSGVWGNAIDYWTKPTDRLLQSFDRASGTAQGGDIVILKPTATNPYGHIMVAINGSTAIEQNGYTGDGSGTGNDAVRYRAIPYDRVAGLLRPKQKGNPEVIIGTDQGWYDRMNRFHHQLVMNADLSDPVWQAVQGKVLSDVLVQWSDHPNADNLIHEQEVGEVALRDNWQGQIGNLTQTDQTLQSQVTTLTQQVAELTATSKSQKDEFDSKLGTLVQQGKDKDAVIADLQAKAALTSEDTQQLNKLGEVFKWAIKRFGLSK